jgi:hypothetical protein
MLGTDLAKAIKQSLFLIKFTTTFIKGAPTCKHSKLSFLIGQEKAL